MEAIVRLLSSTFRADYENKQIFIKFSLWSMCLGFFHCLEAILHWLGLLDCSVIPSMRNTGRLWPTIYVQWEKVCQKPSWDQQHCYHISQLSPGRDPCTHYLPAGCVIICTLSKRTDNISGAYGHMIVGNRKMIFSCW